MADQLEKATHYHVTFETFTNGMDGKFENDQADKTGISPARLFQREIASQDQKEGKKKSR